jgi:rod shape determining protein RodA
MLRGTFAHIDWVIFSASLLLAGAGLITMYSFAGENPLFERQIIWLSIAIIIFFICSVIDFRFLRRTEVVTGLLLVAIGVLSFTLLVGAVFQGASRWIDVGLFAIQPSDPAKLVVIAVLAKYFSRRHVEIANVRHVLVSGAYAGVLAGLVFLQPDFGSSIIIGVLWLGLVLVSGISKKHLAAVVGIGVLSVMGMWFFALEDYQKNRITTFLNPYTDIQGAGYNAYQSTIAVGSGQVWGKGIGYGTQSKLKFLPEYETDFIFAAFAEEWGLIGSMLLLLLYGVIIWRITAIARLASTNFEMLFASGVAILFITHVIIHVGMNIGLLPVTGTTIPFMSYGGSHLVTEFMALGILMGMRTYGRVVERRQHGEDIGVEVR